MTYKFWPLFKAQWCFKEGLKVFAYFHFAAFSQVILANTMDWVNNSLFVNIYIIMALTMCIIGAYMSLKLISDLVLCGIITMLAKHFDFAKKAYTSWMQ